MIRALPNAQDELLAHIVRNNAKSFVWGSRDCMLFVADCIKIVTGKDFAAIYRGRYGNEKEALTLIRETSGAENYLQLFEDIFQKVEGVSETDFDNSFVFGVVSMNKSYYGAVMHEGYAIVFQPRRHLILDQKLFVKKWGIKWQ